MAGEHALRYAAFLTGQSPPPASADGDLSYDCSEVKLMAARHWWKWEQWNVLAFLEWIRERTGVEVALVHWPLSHNPRDDCYNARFTNRLVMDFESWIHREARSRGIPLLNLRESLPNQAFFDTIHLNEQGHRLIAPRIQSFVMSVMENPSRDSKRE